MDVPPQVQWRSLQLLWVSVRVEKEDRLMGQVMKVSTIAEVLGEVEVEVEVQRLHFKTEAIGAIAQVSFGMRTILILRSHISVTSAHSIRRVVPQTVHQRVVVAAGEAVQKIYWTDSST
jgi:hypothetical protein